MENVNDLKNLSGLAATVNLTGSVEHETASCALRMALHNAERGFTNIEYRTFAAQLVEAGRDHVCEHALSEDYDYLLMYDGDSTFSEDALIRLLQTAYVEVPDADAVGAYSQLKGSFIPTIDTGSGTWEPIFPGEGTLPVIRTGGHFLLVKTDALKRFGPPWFRTRRTLRPVDVLSELDNLARIKFDGRNPLQQTEAWSTLHEIASSEAADQRPASVGEDSGFADALKNAGGQIYVNTNVVTGHVSKKVIGPSDLRDRLDQSERAKRLRVGVYE